MVVPCDYEFQSADAGRRNNQYFQYNRSFLPFLFLRHLVQNSGSVYTIHFYSDKILNTLPVLD